MFRKTVVMYSIGFFSLFLICLFIISILIPSGNITVNYYVDLITKEISRANTYRLPQDSSAYSTPSKNYTVYGTFDYIIIGAGSAGAVIASRLSEIPGNQILLLEAGSHETDFSDIPGMAMFLQGLEFNWNYNTTPQTSSCLGMLNRECAYPRGKGVGGSSIINSLKYIRGNGKDYDNWALNGNPGWSYQDVLPYFKKSENSHIDGDEGYHGSNGYLNVEYSKPQSPQFNAFIDANIELGRQVVDYNGKEQLGVSRIQYNTISGRRDSAKKAFLLPAQNRSNLKILVNALVTKIVVNPLNRQAQGVIFTYKQNLLKAAVRKEIILCAGTIGSPQLLMLSGIGPKHHLASLKIKVIQNLEVGSTLWDHPAYYGLSFNTNYFEPSRSLKEFVEGYLNDYGAFTTVGNAQGVGFYQTNMTNIPGYPDIEIIIAVSNNTNDFIKKAFHFTDQTYANVFSKVNPSQAFRLFIILLHPKSQGTVRLKSKSPYDYPLIDPNSLADENGEDLETMYQGIQLALQMIHTKAFKKLNATLINSTVQECLQYDYLSRDYWYCQLKQITAHIYHPTGTCKMGPDPHNGAVVNHKLQVYGIHNLRIADASVIPQPTSGHTHAPTVMIAEKLADMIKNGV